MYDEFNEYLNIDTTVTSDVENTFSVAKYGIVKADIGRW